MSIDRKNEYEALLDLLEKGGGNAEEIKNNIGANMILNKDEIISVNETEGIKLKATKIPDGVKASIIIKEGYKETKPVHLCFGILPKEGKQVIISEIIAKKNSKVKILSHCIFPNAVHIQHIMEGKIILEEGAELIYEEEHYHSEEGLIEVKPVQEVVVEKNARYFNHFKMKNGRAGKINIDYLVILKEKAVSELTTKIGAKLDDKIKMKEKIILEGKESRGLILSRIVLRDNSTSEFVGITVGKGAYSKAHVDCSEIVMDNAKASAIPEIQAFDSTAKLTHEAAIGRIDQKQLYTLMAKGLSEKQAIEYLVNGLLN